MNIKMVLGVVIMSLFMNSCETAENTNEETVIVIKNANVIPMTGEYVLENKSVMIRDGKIISIGRFEDISIEGNTEVIDAEGKFLTPGFSDMHVHNYTHEQDLLFLANGVTSIRNMGIEGILELRERINSKELLGPEIVFTTGPILDGVNNYMPASLEVVNTDEIEALIKKMKDDGYDGVKVYDDLKPNVYREIMRVSRELEFPVVGHVPRAITIEEAVKEGQYSFEHLGGFNSENIENEIKAIVDSGVWICNTEIVKFYIDKCFTRDKNPEIFSETGFTPELKYALPYFGKTFWPNYPGSPIDMDGCAVLLKVLHDVGANIVSGTDAGTVYSISGFSLHKEFVLMNEAGLTPYEVLLTTTVNPAKMLGLTDRLGTIEKGKDADLVLLDENPLIDIRNTSSIAGVMVKGNWLPKEELDNLLSQVERNYEAMEEGQ